MNKSEINTREIRAASIVTHGLIKEKDGFYYVPSVSNHSKSYRVDLKNEKCGCLDFMFRQTRCKHLIAAAIYAKQPNETTKKKTRTETALMPPRRTYSQSWSKYNKAQVNEKAEFLKLLSQLCAGIEEPEQTNGRPRMSLADMVFCCVYKTYSTVSGRRFAGELQAAFELGYLSQLPSYHSMFRYFEKPELREILERLIVESSKPLAALESSFCD